MSDCIFCKIINKEIESEIVYEDKEIIAFKDVHPVAPVHILVIPKEHIEKITEVEDGNIIGNIYLVINKLAKEYNISEKGFRVVVNCGHDGGQTVNHLHFHLIGGRKLEIKDCS